MICVEKISYANNPIAKKNTKEKHKTQYQSENGEEPKYFGSIFRVNRLGALEKSSTRNALVTHDKHPKRLRLLKKTSNWREADLIIDIWWNFVR